MDFVGKAKWDAWKKLEGTSKEDAKRTYIEHLRMVCSSYLLNRVQALMSRCSRSLLMVVTTLPRSCLMSSRVGDFAVRCEVLY